METPFDADRGIEKGFAPDTQAGQLKDLLIEELLEALGIAIHIFLDGRSILSDTILPVLVGKLFVPEVLAL